MNCVLCNGNIGFGKQEDIADINNCFLASEKAVCYNIRNHIFPICESCGSPVFANMTDEEILKTKIAFSEICKANSQIFVLDRNDLMSRAFVTSAVAQKIGRTNEYYWSTIALVDLGDIIIADNIAKFRAMIEKDENEKDAEKLKNDIVLTVNRIMNIKKELYLKLKKPNQLTIGVVMFFAELAIDFGEIMVAKKLLGELSKNEKVYAEFSEVIEYLKNSCEEKVE